MINRRAFVASALLNALAAPALRAQSVRPPVHIGFLRIIAPPQDHIDALEQGCVITATFRAETW